MAHPKSETNGAAFSTKANSSTRTNKVLLIFSFIGALNLSLLFPSQIWLNKNFQSTSHHGDQPALPSGSSALDIPTGTAVALPSIRVSEQESAKDKRKWYGGVGDKPHLGGFIDIDLEGISPAMWKYMVESIGVKSFLDVGCGRGFSTSWFATHGVDTLCVEGSHDAVVQSLAPSITVEHDFSRGPWWPPHTVDAVWSVEFLEHVGRNYMKNYIPAFRKAAIIFVTNSIWGGWHHVEVHKDEWWIRKLELLGFKYLPDFTKEIRKVALDEKYAKIPAPAPDGENYNAVRLWSNLKVFINPVVAALPEHHHLFAEPGCFEKRVEGVIYHRDCNTGEGEGLESVLPESFLPIKLTPEMDAVWEDLVRKHVKPANETK